MTSYFDTAADEQELIAAYRNAYDSSAFTFVTDQNPDLKMVVNTNKAVVQVKKIGSKALVVSTIDNLLKGASGQAVQNMNLIFGLDEKTGLHLKSSGF